jgi:hypothetical protein
LRHGFYSQAQDEAMIALGEDPKEYAGLMQRLVDDLNPSPGLQSELVRQMGRTLWRIQRAERMQDGLAVKRVKNGLEMEALRFGPKLMENHGIYQRLANVGQMMNRPNSCLSDAEIEALVTSFGDAPTPDIQSLFPLMRAYGKATAKAPTYNSGADDAIPSTPEEQEVAQAREALQETLYEVMFPYTKTEEQCFGELEKTRSPENIAALMAPRDKSSLLMQRMEDSNLRQLWRVTRMFYLIKGKAADNGNSAENDYIAE